MFSAGVVLVDGCSLLAMALLTEPWRIANRNAGDEVARWTLASWHGSAVVASNGMELSVDAVARELVEDDALDAVIVLASDDVGWAGRSELVSWLAEVGDTDVLLAGVDAGPELLAEAGVLRGHVAAMHHEIVDVFRERFYGIDLTYGRYNIDERRATCAGSSTTLDFSLALLTRFVSPAVAAGVADTLMHTPHADPAAPVESATRMLDDRLRRAMHVIATDSAEPGVVRRAADAAGISDRHLQRLFSTELAMTPREFAQRVRMRRAETLLRETRLPIGSIAVACGYGGASDFNRAFRAQFGRTPTEHRSAAGRA